VIAAGSSLPLSLRLAARELRGGLAGFRIFLACLALGVAAIAAVGSVSSSIVTGLRQDARGLLGGDLELRLLYRPATEDQLRYLAGGGALAEMRDMRSMARRPDGEKRTLVELKAVDDGYPLYGELLLDPAQTPEQALGLRNGRWGVAVDPLILSRLGLKLGNMLRVGDADLEIRATVAREPDLGGIGFVLGPRVMVAIGGLEATGLVQPGALVGYNYRLRLPPGSDVAGYAEKLKQRFPDAGWRIRVFGEAAPSLQRLLERIALFLTLVGLTALLVGGVGVGNAVRGYLGGKTATIATLKCLGAPGALIFRVYLAQILALALLAILFGVAVGALTPFLVAHFLADELPIAARLGIYPVPLLLAAAFGVLVTLAFSLWPLGRARAVSAASLFRDVVAPAFGRPGRSVLIGTALAAAALAALAVATAEDRRIALWFVGGSAAAFLVFHLAGLGVMAAARRAGRPRLPGLRLALANLHRPGAPTPSVVLSLGLGLTVLVAVALIQGNLLHEIEERVPAEAPSYFFIDIQPDQVAGFDAIVRATPGFAAEDRVPFLRGRIVRLGGTPVESAAVAPEAQWAIRSDRGVTYAAAPPPGTEIAEGTWWPADYKGKPLVSFDAQLARGMGLKVGDTITVNVLGRDITATIANLRHIDWTSLGINFTLVFAPGPLETAPHTWLASVRVAPESEEVLQREVTDRFANVTAIRVKDALARVTQIFDSIAAAVQLTAAVTLAAGVLVLAGAVAAGHRRRVYDAVVLKVLGATRGDVTRAFLLEYALLGAVTVAIAALLGSLAAWAILTRVMHADWVFLPRAVLLTGVLSLGLTLVLGFAGTWRALGVKAAPLLRNE
jgi:putative ABC transport system permease protein